MTAGTKPPPELLSRGMLVGGNLTVPSLGLLDANRDGKVSRDELANFLSGHEAGPLHQLVIARPKTDGLAIRPRAIECGGRFHPPDHRLA